MDKFVSGDANLEVTRKMLEAINHTTDDYLFVMDIANDTIWFFGDIDKDYAIRKEGSEVNTTAEMMRVVHPADCQMLSADLDRIAKGEQDTHDLNYRWINRRGEVVWVNCRGRVIKDEHGAPSVMIGRVSEEALRHLYNPLTGLWNKEKLREDMGERLKRPGVLLLLDINGLAAINLSHGRDYGDTLLREVAELLNELEVVEQAYHINHNNFAAVLSVKTDKETEETYRYICERMNEKCTFYAGAVPIKNDVFADVGQLIDSANVTLKKAREKGVVGLELFSLEEIQQRIESLTLLEELKHSVENGCEGFELVYQPQVKSGDYQLYGVEALLRYTSPSRGRVFPDEFIPLLENSRLILPVGMWVLEQALAQCKAWRRMLPSLRVSVNFSSVQFEDPRLGEKIVDCLKHAGMPGSALMVELTESVQLHQSERFGHLVKYLKAYGVGLAIDDFGTGYSNLGYLKQLEVDEVKIDRSFVSGVETGTYNYKLISNVLEFAKANDIHVCCEGVETANELAVLEALRPDLIQGYLFDRPRSVVEIESSYLDESSESYHDRTQNIRRIYAFKEHVDVIHFDPKDILRENRIGLWVMRIDVNEKAQVLHIDEILEDIMGIDRKYAPRECFSYWYDRIDLRDKDCVQNRFELMVETEKMVQVDYRWVHPTAGTVMVRCSGKRVQTEDEKIVIEGYFRIISNVEGA